MHNSGLFTLLIIDDSLLVGKRLIELIKPISSIKIIGQATTAKQGIEFCKTQKPDIVLLDVSLPDGKGLDVLLQLKKIKEETEVIILSNSAGTIVENKFNAAGANYFLDKTQDFMLLPAVIEKIVEAKSNNYL